uniref:c-type cytochrome n=1 Tax=Flavobacterium sp. TaxID=239 RepID=UPI0040494C3A
MKKVGNHNSIAKILRICLVFLVVFSFHTNAQDVANGKALFNSNCAACHNLDRPMTGPALRGVVDKYEGDKEWLYKWIRNSSGLIKSGDERANKIFNEYKQSVMTLFPQLTDENIEDILAYTSEPKPPIVAGGPTVGPDVNPVKASGISNEIILGALSLVLAMLIVMLFLVRNVLTRIAQANGIEVAASEKSIPIWQAYAKNQFLVLVTVIFLLLSSAYFAYGWFMQIGVDQGYEPIQPIHYSHRIHAGDNEIDCKYCHSSARESKHSGIPSLNVCMNCHKNIAEVAAETLAEGNEYGVNYNDEIQKLYTAVGWDQSSQSYTGETKPVKWVRIHNLPDFAYFNHAQHVTVAGVECQTCHGPVQEMEIMYQYAPLTMGWCINCHRETDVKIQDNEYYQKIHEELSKKYGKDKLTAADMGGLECGKCHY